MHTHPTKILHRVAQSMLSGPTDFHKWPCRAAGRQANQPVTTIHRRTEHRIGRTQRAERVLKIIHGHVGNVAAYQHNPGVAEAPENPVHADAKVTMALIHADPRIWQPQPRNIGRDGKPAMKTPFAGKLADT